jgi:hypothetical protein
MELLVAKNPYATSRLPYLIMVPTRPQPTVLRAREPWPKATAVFCQRLGKWPIDADVIERIPLRTCSAHGSVVEVIADRAQHRATRLTISQRAGKEVIFWHSETSIRAGRSTFRLPVPPGRELDGAEVLVDARERYAYKFGTFDVTSRRTTLTAGDYGILDESGGLVASVERKSLDDFTRCVLNGRIGFQMAALEAVPRGAVVVEARFADIVKLAYDAKKFMPRLATRLQVQHPTVPIFFAGNRTLAENWTYLFLTSARAELATTSLPVGGAL